MKIKFYIFFTTVLIFVSQIIFAQADLNQAYYHGAARFATKSNVSEPEITPNSTGQSGTGANIDVKYHKVWWRINPDSIVTVSSVQRGYIKGYVQTNFVTTQASVSSITFDMYSGLTADSVRFRGAKLAAGNITRSGNIVTIALGTTLSTGTLDSIWIYYKGITPAISGAAQGYQPITATTATVKPTGSSNIINTLSESYEDRDWWPCKADMQDKIDSMDINVNVPWGTPSASDTFWVASNGVLVDSAINGTSRTFSFKTRYPIASYLVAVSVAHYKRYYRNINIGGTDMQVVYNLLEGKSATEYQAIQDSMDRINQVVAAFSTKYGDYPYKREKHGFYDGLVGAGGMEHQTFSAIDPTELTNMRTLSHELMHQWFGDKTTFATWADIWLAEGFARYGEALAGELVPATSIDPVTVRSGAKTSARTLTTNRTKITSFTTSAQVWTTANVRAMYDRGCMVVSMLRALSGDNNYFQACRNYLDSANGSGYKSSTTDSLKNNFNKVLNYDLTPFFNDWVIGQGHPTAVVNWNAPLTNRLAISMGTQTRSASATATYFHNVIVLRVQGALAANDTTIVIYDIDGNNLAKAGLSTGIGASVPGNLLMYTLSFTPTTVTFDSYNQTMSAGSINKITTLAVNTLNFTAKKTNTGNQVNLLVSNTEAINKIVLQKSSNGIDFTDAGEMNKLSTNNQENYYQLIDALPYLPTTFYRAKIYTALKEEYTAIIKMQEQVNKNITVWPSPANNMVVINFANTQKKKTTIRVINAEAKVVFKTLTTNDFLHVDVSNLSSGIYIVQVIDDGKVTDIKKIQVRH
jgi:aminopeptidase N